MKNTLTLDRWTHVLLPSTILAGLAWFACARDYTLFSVICTALAFINAVFMVFFFRDPVRSSMEGPECALAGADGTIRSVERIEDTSYVGEPAIRISIYLSPMDVHINRSPIPGKVTELGYTPGKHLLTRSNAASEYNEHSSILIEGEQLKCRVHQIVGPLVRRVVYWLEEGQGLCRGERIGLMKFGSRLDMYFPASQIEVLVKEGEQVQAGVSPVARCI